MAGKSQFALLGERRFLPFFLTQFFGAANDNVFKFAFSVLATYSAAEWGGLEPKSAGAVIGGIFILPFVIFSATAGQLDVFHLSPARPQLLAVPPWVWHGVQNLAGGVSSFVNMFDRPYDYDDPDEWRLPPDSQEIPYSFD